MDNRASMVTLAAMLILFAAACPLFTVVPKAHANLPAITQSDLKLVVQPMAPTLPADGGTYFMSVQLQTAKDSIPIEAMKDTIINLTASDPSLLQIPAQVTLPQGQTYVNVNVNTTSKVGTVQITALASNTAAGSIPLTTIQLNTLQPSKLAIYGAPAKSIPDPRFIGKVYVQLLNAQGLPARAQASVLVTLASSDPQIVQVPSYAYIDPGNSGTVVDFVPGYESGQVQISATSAGLAPATTQVVTTGLVATKIFVDYGPKVVPAMVGASATVIVQLRDPNDFPVKAYQTTRIFLKSSITSVGTLPDYVDIQPGQSYGIVTFTGGGSTGGQLYGSTQITASAPGLQSGLVTLYTISEVSSVPRNLYVFAVPNVLPPDSTQSPTIFYVYTDGDPSISYNVTGVVGRPVPTYFPGNLGPTITSSNLRVGDIAGGIALQPYYGITSFKTTFKTGDAFVTVSQNGLRSWQDKLSTMGPQPSALSLTQVPSVIQADGGSYKAIMVGLLDQTGNAVPASEDTIVYLTSSTPDILTTDSSVVIPAGQSFAIASITTTTIAGQATVSASANGLTSASVGFTTTGFTSPYTLGLSAVPNNLPSDGKPHPNIVVQLHDLLGNPTQAPANIPIALSSSSLSAGDVDRTVIIPAGSTYAIANFTARTVPPSSQVIVQNLQALQVTASAQGFQTVTSSLNIGSQSLEVSTSDIGAPGFTKTPIGVDVYTSSFPLSGATVTVSGLHADTMTALTNSAGHADAIFSPTQPGDNSVVITVTKPGYLPFMQTTTINIRQSIDLKVNAATQHGRELGMQMAILPPIGDVVTKKTDVNQPVEIKNGDFGKYTITAPTSFEDASGRYKFVSWSDGIMDNPRSTNIYIDSNLTAIYSAEYYLDISSQYGTVTGNGWHAEGTTATIDVTPAIVPGIIFDNGFAGWSGDIQADGTSAGVLMDGPKSVTANWHPNFMKIFIIGGLGGSGAGVYIYMKKIMPKRKQKAEAQEDAPPDLDWFKP